MLSWKKNITQTHKKHLRIYVSMRSSFYKFNRIADILRAISSDEP